MFIYSIRSGTVKLFSLILLALLMLIFILNVGEERVVATVGGVSVSYGNIKTNEQRVAFIKEQGVNVNETPEIEESFAVPDSFDRIIGGYNEIQKSQGLDMTKYKGKRVTHYAYKAIDYDYNGTVYVNLYLHKSRIIACDISSVDGKGFVKPLVSIASGES